MSDMNLAEELRRLEETHDGRFGHVPHDALFWKKIEIWQEMAKRIEALERHEHSHPLGAGSYREGRSAKAE